MITRCFQYAQYFSLYCTVLNFLFFLILVILAIRCQATQNKQFLLLLLSTILLCYESLHLFFHLHGDLSVPSWYIYLLFWEWFILGWTWTGVVRVWIVLLREEWHQIASSSVTVKSSSS